MDNTTHTSRSLRWLSSLGLIAGLLAVSSSEAAANTGSVQQFYGSFGTEVPIDVPKFRSITPSVKVTYASGGSAGLAGIGASVAATSFVQRSRPGGGVPKYDSTDTYRIDGQELIPCTSMGGTHCTELQSYTRITRDTGANKFYVWSKNGTKMTYEPVFNTSRGTFRWALKTVQDVHGNTATYNYWCQLSGSYPLECYIDTITYNSNTIRFYRETRPDVQTYSTGAGMGRVNYRIKTIEVKVGSSRAAAYKLSYSTSPLTGRSRLTQVRKYGSNVTISSGSVTGGSSLPAFELVWPTTYGGWATNSDYDTGATGQRIFYNGVSGMGDDNWKTIRYADVDGNGYMDACMRRDAGLQCYLNDGTGFNYSSGYTTSIFSNSVSGMSEDNWATLQFADIDADGKSDVCMRLDTGFKCYRSTGYGFSYWSSYTTSLLPNGNPLLGEMNENNWRTIRLVDVTGDSLPDLCARLDCGVVCYPNTGSGFGAAGNLDSCATGQAIYKNGYSQDGYGDFDDDNWKTFAMADVNADGKADACVRNDQGVECWLSTGTGWQWSSGFDSGYTYNKASNIQRIFKNGFDQQGWGNMDDDNKYSIQFVDVNGDGASDVCGRMDYGMHCFLSTGNGWQYESGYNSKASGQYIYKNGFSQHGYGDFDSDNWSHIRYADINADGKQDVCIRGDYGLECWQSTGDGWRYDSDYDSYADGTYVFKNGTSQRGYGGYDADNMDTIEWVDVTGDGIIDVCARMDFGLWCYVNTAKHENVETTKNGIGGSSDITYTPSSSWSNSAMPEGMVVQTVSAVATHDGRGNSSTTNYSYEGGLYSWEERRFLGFRKVTGVIDAAGNYTETYYLQRVGSIAKPEYTYFRDPTGKIFSYSVMNYTENASKPYTSLMTSRWDYECNLSASCRRIYTTFTYDQYANVTRSDEYGDYDQSGDERTTERGFYPNTSAFVVNAPGYENVYDGIGTSTLVARKRFYYDGQTSYTSPPVKGNVTKKSKWDSKTGGYIHTTYDYDQWGNQTRTTDPSGGMTTTDWDTTYHMYPIRDCGPLGWCKTTSWNYVLGVISSQTETHGYEILYEWDVFGRKTKEVRPDGSYTTYTRYSTGSAGSQRIRETHYGGAAGSVWTDVYRDGLDRAWKTVKKGGSNQITEYLDTSERIWKKSNWHYSTETPQYQVYAYDGAGRVRTITNPGGTSSEVVYYNGYVVHFDELDHERAVWKDGLGRLTQIREKKGGSYYYTTNEYDAMDNMVRSVDAKGNVTTATWDSLGNRTASCDPNRGCWSYEYNNAGRLIKTTNAKGQVTNYTWGPGGRLTKVSYADGQKVEYFYDEAGHGASTGRVTTVRYPEGSESVSYDYAGRPVSATRCVGETCKTMSQTYDGLGRMATVRFPDCDEVTYSYNSNGQLSAVSGYVSSLSYNAAGQITSLSYTNGTTQTYSYNAARNWLTGSSVTSGSATLYQASYGYDNAARVTSVSSSTHAKFNLGFGYDALNRLTSVSGAQTQTFAYDALGNITNNSLVGAYKYQDVNHVHAVSKAGGTNLYYDANGNLLSDGSRVFNWDARGLLASVVKSGVTTTFAYDSEGQRIRKGNHLYFGKLLEQKPDGTLVKYIGFNQLLFAKKEGTTKSWYHSDHLGSIRLMTDSSGNEVRKYEYRAFGEQLSATGTANNQRGFGGHDTDDDLGLIYMSARYYDPVLGRFISADEITPDADDPQSRNRYSFALNNPVSNVDPSGHAPVVAAVVGLGITLLASPPTWVAVVAIAGAAATVAGYVLQSPLLSTVGAILTGFAGGYMAGAGLLAGPGIGGGLWGAGMAALTSPLSPLDPGIKKIVGWAYMGQQLVHMGLRIKKGMAGGGEGPQCPVSKCETIHDRAIGWTSPDGTKNIYATGWGTAGVKKWWENSTDALALMDDLSTDTDAILALVEYIGDTPPEMVNYYGHSLAGLEGLGLVVRGKVAQANVWVAGVPSPALNQAVMRGIDLSVVHMAAGSRDGLVGLMGKVYAQEGGRISIPVGNVTDEARQWLLSQGYVEMTRQSFWSMWGITVRNAGPIGHARSGLCAAGAFNGICF